MVGGRIIVMKKLLVIVVLGLLLNGNAFAKKISSDVDLKVKI